jgi:hypothetical protein
VSFDPSLPTDKDWVRLLIGDTDPTDEAVDDSTIAAILVEVMANGASAAGAKYCAAAQAGSVAAAFWIASTGGVVEKQVSKLRIQYGGGGQQSALAAYDAYLNGLRQKCTDLSLSKPALLKAW